MQEYSFSLYNAQISLIVKKSSPSVWRVEGIYKSMSSHLMYVDREEPIFPIVIDLVNI